MNSRRLHAVLVRFRASFLATFPALTPQDFCTLLGSPSETLLDILQSRYGYTRAQAKAAWNDFVLTHVDGCEDCDRRPARAAIAPAYGAGQALGADLWHLMRMGWGRPSAAPGIGPLFCAPQACPLYHHLH